MIFVYDLLGLCSWVINIVKYYEVYCTVEPKRIALNQANAELDAARDRLRAIKNKVAELEETLAKLALVSSEFAFFCLSS